VQQQEEETRRVTVVKAISDISIVGDMRENVRDYIQQFAVEIALRTARRDALAEDRRGAAVTRAARRYYVRRV